MDTHSTCLAYDSQDRLSQVRLPNGSTVSMSYDTAGERASYTVVLSGSTTLQELFTYRGDQVGQVITSGTGITDTYTDTYVYLGDSSPYELIRQYTSKVTCGGQSTLTCKYFYVLDGRGNAVALVDRTGTVVDRYSYDVWGVPTIILENVKQPLLYAGYWYDRELSMPNETTGWYWLSVRPVTRPAHMVRSRQVFRLSDPVRGVATGALAARHQVEPTSAENRRCQRTGQGRAADRAPRPMRLRWCRCCLVSALPFVLTGNTVRCKTSAQASRATSRPPPHGRQIPVPHSARRLDENPCVGPHDLAAVA